MPSSDASSSAAPYLRLLEPLPAGTLPDEGPIVRLDRPITQAGSRRTARLFLSSHTVSRAHCLFVVRPDGVMVRDTVSRSGTLVNGDAVDEAVLEDGDEVQLGRFRFTFFEGELPTARDDTRAGPAELTAILPDGGVLTKKVAADRQTLLIGRREGMDLVLPSSQISTAHLALIRLPQAGGNGFAAFDLGGKGSTRNGKRLKQAVLKNGDTLTAGPVEITLAVDIPKPAASRRPASPVAEAPPVAPEPPVEPEAEAETETPADESLSDFRRQWQKPAADDVEDAVVEAEPEAGSEPEAADDWVPFDEDETASDDEAPVAESEPVAETEAIEEPFVEDEVEEAVADEPEASDVAEALPADVIADVVQEPVEEPPPIEQIVEEAEEPEPIETAGTDEADEPDEVIAAPVAIEEEPIAVEEAPVAEVAPPEEPPAEIADEVVEPVAEEEVAPIELADTDEPVAIEEEAVTIEEEPVEEVAPTEEPRAEIADVVIEPVEETEAAPIELAEVDETPTVEAEVAAEPVEESADVAIDLAEGETDENGEDEGVDLSMLDFDEPVADPATDEVVAEVEPEPTPEPLVEPEPVAAVEPERAVEPVAEVEPEPVAKVEPEADVDTPVRRTKGTRRVIEAETLDEVESAPSLPTASSPDEDALFDASHQLVAETPAEPEPAVEFEPSTDEPEGPPLATFEEEKRFEHKATDDAPDDRPSSTQERPVTPVVKPGDTGSTGKAVPLSSWQANWGSLDSVTNTPPPAVADAGVLSFMPAPTPLAPQTPEPQAEAPPEPEPEATPEPESATPVDADADEPDEPPIDALPPLEGKPKDRPTTVGFGTSSDDDLPEIDETARPAGPFSEAKFPPSNRKDAPPIGPASTPTHDTPTHESSVLDPSFVMPETSGLTGTVEDFGLDAAVDPADLRDTPADAVPPKDDTRLGEALDDEPAVPSGGFLRVIRNGVDPDVLNGNGHAGEYDADANGHRDDGGLGVATAVAPAATATRTVGRPAGPDGRRRRPRVPPTPKRAAVARATATELQRRSPNRKKAVALVVGTTLIAMVGVVAAVLTLAGPTSVVEGRLRHEVPQNLPIEEQILFEQTRVAAVSDPNVRNEAAAILRRQAPDVSPGWLAGAGVEDVFASFIAEPPGTMIVERKTKNAEAGRARVEALLRALAASDQVIRDESAAAKEAADRRRGRRLGIDVQAGQVTRQLQDLRTLQNQRALAEPLPTAEAIESQLEAIRQSKTDAVRDAAEARAALAKLADLPDDAGPNGEPDPTLAQLRQQERNLERDALTAAPSEKPALADALSSLGRRIELREAELSGERRRAETSLRRDIARAAVAADTADTNEDELLRQLRDVRDRRDEDRRLQTQIDEAMERSATLDEELTRLREEDEQAAIDAAGFVYATDVGEISFTTGEDERPQIMAYGLLAVFALGLAALYLVLRRS